jgi:hypothetical protein
MGCGQSKKSTDRAVEPLEVGKGEGDKTILAGGPKEETKIEATEANNDVQSKVEEPPTEKPAAIEETKPDGFVQASTDAHPKTAEPQTRTTPLAEEAKPELTEACNEEQSKAEEPQTETLPAVEGIKQDAAVVDRGVPVDDAKNLDASIVETKTEDREAKIDAMTVEGTDAGVVEAKPEPQEANATVVDVAEPKDQSQEYPVGVDKTDDDAAAVDAKETDDVLLQGTETEKSTVCSLFGCYSA